MDLWKDRQKLCGSCPDYAQFNVNSLQDFMETLLVLHPLPDGDFYCSYAGPRLDRDRRQDLTGRAYSKIGSVPASELATCFSAVLESGQPILALQVNGRSGHGLEHAIVPVESPLGRLIISNTVPATCPADMIDTIIRSWPGTVTAHSAIVGDDGDLTLPRADVPLRNPARSPSDGDHVLTFVDLGTFRQAYADLDQRERDLIEMKADLERQETVLAAIAEEINQARMSFNRQASEQRRLEVELRRLAETDDLTGHLNRRAFFRELQIEVTRSKRYGHPPTLLYLDIDRFKSINDTRGHAAGDAIIRTAMQRIVSVLRSSVDLVGRLGGDEFAILLPETMLSGAQVVAERIRLMISDKPFAFLDQMIAITVSIGIAAWNDAADAEGLPEPVEDWVARADAALYQAKHSGRNAICRAAPRQAGGQRSAAS